MARIRNNLRVMVDANVLFSGSLWPRWSFEVLHHAIQSDFQLVLTQYVIQQIHRRIRNQFRDYLPHFHQLLQTTDYEAAPDPTSDQVSRYRGLVRDITDVPVALGALNAQVDYLVSEDKDLTAKNESTLQLHQQLKILIPGTFLREVMGWTSEQLEVVRNRSWPDLPAPVR